MSTALPLKPVLAHASPADFRLTLQPPSLPLVFPKAGSPEPLPVPHSWATRAWPLGALRRPGFRPAWRGWAARVWLGQGRPRSWWEPVTLASAPAPLRSPLPLFPTHPLAGCSSRSWVLAQEGLLLSCFTQGPLLHFLECRRPAWAPQALQGFWGPCQSRVVATPAIPSPAGPQRCLCTDQSLPLHHSPLGGFFCAHGETEAPVTQLGSPWVGGLSALWSLPQGSAAVVGGMGGEEGQGPCPPVLSPDARHSVSGRHAALPLVEQLLAHAIPSLLQRKPVSAQPHCVLLGGPPLAGASLCLLIPQSWAKED